MRRHVSVLLTIVMAAAGATAVPTGPAAAGPAAGAAGDVGALFGTVPPPPQGPPPPPSTLNANADFEGARFTRELSGWSCDERTRAVQTGHPEHGWALAGAPSASSAAGCEQVIPVRPNSVYLLGFSFRGGPVEVGVVELGADGT